MEGTTTSFQVVAVTQGGVQSGGLPSGGIPASGKTLVPAASITKSGTYMVLFTRTFPDGDTLTASSDPFQASVLNIEAASGTYEALLKDSTPGGSPDGASSRGIVTCTLNRNGSLSGRVTYLEPIEIPNAPQPDMRAYKPSVISFAGVFSAQSSQPDNLVFSPAPGSTNLPQGRTLSLELDLTQTPPAVALRIQRTASGPIPASPDCAAEDIPKVFTKLPAELNALSGRYVLNAPAPASAFTLAQVTPTGRVAWTTKMPGYTGSGSTALRTDSLSQPSAVFFEGRAIPSTAFLSSLSLSGGFEFTPDSAASHWNAHLTSEENPSALELQETHISLTEGIPAYRTAAFADGSEKTGVSLLHFTPDSPTRWDASDPSGIFAGLQNRPLILETVDPLPDAAGNPVRYAWNVVISPLGTARVTSLTISGVKAPQLALRFDRTTGQLTGTYRASAPGAAKRLLNGVVDQSDLTAQHPLTGWVEIGAWPHASSSDWSLSVVSP